MGGQIMPPVMGAVAFIMAENIGVPYADIVKAAIIPAAALFRLGVLDGASGGRQARPCAAWRGDELPSPLAAFKRQWYLALPLVTLILLLFAGFTPLFAGSVGLALTVMLIIGHAIVGRHGQPRFARRLLDRACACALIAMGGAILPSLPEPVGRAVLMIGIPLCRRRFSRSASSPSWRRSWSSPCSSAATARSCVDCRDALADGARQALAVGLACAIVGTVIGAMTLTGAATTFGNFIVSFGRDSISSASCS